MPLTPTLRAIQAFLLPRTSEVALMTLTVTHTNFAAPLNIVSSRAPITSNGTVFSPRNFQASLPAMSKGALTQIQVVIDDPDRAMAFLYRTISKFDYPLATLSVILASDPNNYLWQSTSFRQKDVQIIAPYGTQQLAMTLGFADVLNEDFPYLKFDPSTYPGLFGRFT